MRDRSPQVRFTGRNYVLPRTGQEGIPVVSVNTSRVEVEIYRIGDRSLCRRSVPDDFLDQLSGYSAEAIANEKGVKDLVGRARHRLRAQPGRGHGFPGPRRRSARSSRAST